MRAVPLARVLRASSNAASSPASAFLLSPREACAAFSSSAVAAPPTLPTTAVVDVQTIAYPVNMHRSDAAARVIQVPVIEVSGHVAMCNGGGGATGHPIEFLQVRAQRGTICPPMLAYYTHVLSILLVPSIAPPPPPCSSTAALVPSRLSAATAACATSWHMADTTTDITTADHLRYRKPGTF